jgi:hypothetical protein
MTAGGEGRCSTCGHAATEHRPRFGCCEATLVGEEWEGCPCNLVSTAVDEMRCSACLHPAHRGPCHHGPESAGRSAEWRLPMRLPARCRLARGG